MKADKESTTEVPSEGRGRFLQENRISSLKSPGKQRLGGEGSELHPIQTAKAAKKKRCNPSSQDESFCWRIMDQVITDLQTTPNCLEKLHQENQPVVPCGPV